MSNDQQSTGNPAGKPRTGFVRSLRVEVGEPTARGIVPALAVCGFVFALVGAVFVLILGSGYGASALVTSSSTTSQLGTLGSSSNQSDASQTELVYVGIAAPVMTAAVSDQLGIANPPPVKVSVEPGTTILNFQAVGDTAEQAAATANISAKTYVAWWRERASAVVQTQLTVTNAQLAKNPSSGELKQLRAELQLQLATIQAEPRILAEATAAGAAQKTSPISGAILGGLVGLLVGTGAILLARRRGQSTGESDEPSG